MRLLRRHARKTQKAFAGKTPTAKVTHALVDMANASPAKKYLRQVALPSKVVGDYKLCTYRVSEGEAKLHNLREAFHGHRFIRPGRYTALVQCGQIWMTDTPAELVDHIEIVDRAYHYGGYVLILGLGLGMVVQAVLEMPQVEGCTVVELSPDVIRLVAPTYKRRYGKRFNVVEADAKKWKPDHLYSSVWADIWPSLCGANLPQIARLRKRYQEHGWFGAWGYEITKAAQREWAAERRQIRRMCLSPLGGDPLRPL
jgi:hypothetical protein